MIQILEAAAAFFGDRMAPSCSLLDVSEALRPIKTQVTVSQTLRKLELTA